MPSLRKPERIVFLAASAALTVAGAKRAKKVELVAKPLVMGSIAAGLARTADTRDRLDNVLLFGAATASFVGDWFMLFEEFAADDEESDRQIQRGASSFAVNHLLLGALALRHGARPEKSEALMRLPGLIEGGAVIALTKPQLLPVLGPYSTLLASFATVIADPKIAGEDELLSGLALGGLSFMASDGTILHRRTFLSNPGARAGAESFVLASYVFAQALIYDGLARLAASRDRP
ncbi:MAG: hypothetical protein JHC98_10195 [Thermoleophilaceae bacterium]|nr:hypothetical protein [Thermoleophilaceae bacterium]